MYEKKRIQKPSSASRKRKEERHDVADVAAGAGGVLLLPVAPVAGAALIGGTAYDISKRHDSGKRKAAKPWQ